MTTTTAVKSAAETAAQTSEREPITKLQKRIGSTLYIVTAYTDPNATETMEDKLLRLIESVKRQTNTYICETIAPI